MSQATKQVIPDDWDVENISSIASKVTDGTHDTPRPVKEGVPFFTAIHIKENSIDYGSCYYLPQKIHDEIYKRCNPELGDVLMVNIGAGTATTALVTVNYHFSLKNVALIKPNDQKLDGRYLNQSLIFKRESVLETLSSGGAQPFLSLTQIGQIKVPVPQLQEQIAIANALSDVDALLGELDKLIAKKQAIKTATMQQLLTGKTRLPQFATYTDGDKQGQTKGTQPSELGETPEDWEVKTYGEIFTFLTTATNSRSDLSESGKVGYIHYGDIHTKWDNLLNVSKANIPHISQDKITSAILLKEGDVIMADASEDYDGIGKSIEVLNLSEKKIISGLHTFLLRDKNDVFANGFKGYLHTIVAVKAIFDRLATGLKVYGLSKANLKDVPLPVPPKEEQTAIATILSDMDEEIQALQQRLSKTRQIKQGMMQELLTGKTRLPFDKVDTKSQGEPHAD
ncbi:restriction endonuclease subunit S [Shewanella intestini]|uniref:Restriction endonuclease subunit S n=1 Tax=Shewanella intestini TaxID=2017544 RepID=A0ABS5I4R8_9GAMM|nr:MULTISPECIES: restriction endonuclease subunit S [Shewanella]MBR9728300.1 restriction endonuclease subunit S [Shewanella intestini]MRG35765.1 restriction endonuclease subunit S [Shewanella sp. XMDDZSB0408]